MYVGMMDALHTYASIYAVNINSIILNPTAIVYLLLMVTLCGKCDQK